MAKELALYSGTLDQVITTRVVSASTCTPSADCDGSRSVYRAAMRGRSAAKWPKEAEESVSPAVKVRLPLELIHNFEYNTARNGKEKGSGVSRESSSPRPLTSVPATEAAGAEGSPLTCTPDPPVPGRKGRAVRAKRYRLRRPVTPPETSITAR